MKVTIPETVLSTDLGEEAVLLNLETGEYFGLDEIGLAMWNGFREGRSLDAIRTALLADYDVDEATLARDLDAFVAQLAQKKLVVVSDE